VAVFCRLSPAQGLWGPAKLVVYRRLSGLQRQNGAVIAICRIDLGESTGSGARCPMSSRLGSRTIVGLTFVFPGSPRQPPFYPPEVRNVKALMLSEYKQLEVTEVPDPECGPNDVLVKVEACGICGSDIHGYDGSSGRRIPPLIMGHEAAGEVVAVGENVQGFQAGMRVTFDSMVSCGSCDFCRKGHRNLCDNRRVLGVSCGEYRRHGAFAELIAVPHHIVYALPESLPYEHAALVEAVSVAVHAVNRTPHQLGDSAVVVGTGMIGLLVVQALKASGFGTVIAVDLADEKLQVAAELGADLTLKGDDPELINKIHQATEGRGAHVAMEVVGATPTVKTAIDAVRKGGTVTLVGNLAPNIELPLQAVVTRELNLLGTCGCNGEYPECIALMEQGRINVEPLISKKIGLSQAAEWFGRLYEGEAGLMKVVVQPQLG
jgi:L-iditol 2-dehydrogenase